MRSRRTITLLSVLAIMLIAAPSAFAVVLSVGSNSGNPGDTLQIPITVDVATAIAGASFTIIYDSDNLTLTTIESSFFDTFANQRATIDPSTDPYPPDSVDVGDPPQTYTWPLLSNDVTGATMIAAARCQAGESNTTLFTLTFDIDANAPLGDYTINIIPSNINNTDAGYDAGGEDIPYLVGADDEEADLTLAFPVIEVTGVNFGTLIVQEGGVDTDDDGLTDADETNIYGTDPNNYDTDGDDIDDGDEVAYWEAHQDASWNDDSDSDGIINLLDFDSDNDGLSDGTEYYDESDPADASSAPAGVIAGTVKDSAGNPITGVGIYVSVYMGNPCGDYQHVAGTTTDSSNGTYYIDNLVGGFYYVRTDNNGNNYVNEWWASSESTYVCNEAESIDLSGVGQAAKDFQLDIGGTISGKVVNESNVDQQDVGVNYWNDVCSAWAGTTTDLNGAFELTGLPPGPAEVIVWPEVDTGLAWFMRDCYLGEGKVRDLGTIILHQGALISGVIKDAETIPAPLPYVQYWYGGRFEMGGGETDSNGYFEFRLPAGIYTLNLSDDSDYVMVPVEIIVTDVNDDITYANLSLTAYDADNGDTISGTVTGSSPPEGMELEVVAFLNSKTFTPDNFGGVGPIGCDEPEAGTYSLFVPPTDARGEEDVMVALALWSEGPDGNESLTVVDWIQDVSTSTSPTDVPLTYTSDGFKVEGYVKDSHSGEGIFDARVLLYNQAEEFVGFAETDHTGKYTFYNVPGTGYKVAVTHRDYPDDTEWSSGFWVSDPSPDPSVSVRDVFMGEEKDKFEGDFDGDGNTDILWRSESTGKLYMWLMNGTTIVTNQSLGTVSLDYEIDNVGDFNGDGNTDILWRSESTGKLYMWLMSGTTIVTNQSLGTVSLDYEIQ